jgi:hypothetical protein
VQDIKGLVADTNVCSHDTVPPQRLRRITHGLFEPTSTKSRRHASSKRDA